MMDKSIFIRNTIIEKLKNSCLLDFKITDAEINGRYFSGADIAFSSDNEEIEVYRIAVIKHNQHKNFT